jgi:hypothetical protein
VNSSWAPCFKPATCMGLFGFAVDGLERNLRVDDRLSNTHLRLAGDVHLDQLPRLGDHAAQSRAGDTPAPQQVERKGVPPLVPGDHGRARDVEVPRDDAGTRGSQGCTGTTIANGTVSCTISS